MTTHPILITPDPTTIDTTHINTLEAQVSEACGLISFVGQIVNKGVWIGAAVDLYDYSSKYQTWDDSAEASCFDIRKAVASLKRKGYPDLAIQKAVSRL